MDIVDKIMKWEDGRMTDTEIIEFFAELVKTGQAWRLQGSYGRMAQRLIDAGYIDKNGLILKYRQKTLDEE